MGGLRASKIFFLLYLGRSLTSFFGLSEIFLFVKWQVCELLRLICRREVRMCTHQAHTSHTEGTYAEQWMSEFMKIIDFMMYVPSVCEVCVWCVHILMTPKTWKYWPWRFQRTPARRLTTKTRFCGSNWLLMIWSEYCCLYEFASTFLSSQTEHQESKIFWHNYSKLIWWNNISQKWVPTRLVHTKKF